MLADRCTFVDNAVPMNSVARWLTALQFGLLLVGIGGAGAAQATNLAESLGVKGGQAIFEATCSGCHGAHGEGTDPHQAGFERPDTFPHFPVCDESQPESTRTWAAVIRGGGPARGFSPIMPAFKDVLTDAQIAEVIDYLRSQCVDRSWPPGELNVPRSIVTEKAFTESEWVLSTATNARGAPGFSSELAYEHMLGARDQLEVAVPFEWQQKPEGGMQGGIGDTAVGIKHVFYANLRRTVPTWEATGSIFALQGEVVLPTGRSDAGFGTGQLGFGVFGAFNHLFRHDTFVSLQGGLDLPLHAADTPRAAFLRGALGKSHYESGFGRMWTPMLELSGNRVLVPGAVTDWDVIPEFQVTLSRRQHVRLALGYLVPLNNTGDRPQQVLAYVLWDWFDGALREGW